MPTKSFESLVLDTLSTGDAFQKAMTALRERAGTMSYEQYVNGTAKIIGKHLGVEPHESRKGGMLTFEKDSAAEQRHTRLKKLHSDYGRTANKPEAVAVRTSVVSSAVREARAAVIARAMTKAEFQAFIASLKDSVSFK